MQLSAKEVKARTQRFERTLRSRGLPLTPQKRAIFAAVAGTASHPTADEVWRAVRRDHPDLSFATVYKNLNKFVDLGLARSLEAGGPARFDANTDDHCHIVDLRTGKVGDSMLSSSLPPPRGIAAARIDRYDLVFYVR